MDHEMPEPDSGMSKTYRPLSSSPSKGLSGRLTPLLTVIGGQGGEPSADLSELSLHKLYALSDKAFRRLDRLVPVDGGDAGYYELMAELDAREALGGIGA